MNDPHVETVYYELMFDSNVQFEPPPETAVYGHPDFDIEVDATEVRISPKEHFADRQSVRAACEPLIRAWEVSMALELGIESVRLAYRKTKTIDRQPTPGVIELQSEDSVQLNDSSSATLGSHLSKYPSGPIVEFSLTADAEFLWQRYLAHRKGREPLPSMAYFVLTVVVALFGTGKRKAAANALNIQEEVLSKIGELSSTRGDNLTARKSNAGTRPLLPNEQEWLRRAIEQLILQVGRSGAGRPVSPLTLTDLPTI